MLDLCNYDQMLCSDLLSYRCLYLEKIQYEFSAGLLDSPIKEKVHEFLMLVSKKQALIKLNESRKNKSYLWKNYLSGIDDVFETYYQRVGEKKYGKNFDAYWRTPYDIIYKRTKRSFPKNPYFLDHKIERNWVNSLLQWYHSIPFEKQKIRCTSINKKHLMPSDFDKMTVSIALKTLLKLQNNKY